jgi:hypothetical protein
MKLSSKRLQQKPALASQSKAFLPALLEFFLQGMNPRPRFLFYSN